MRQKRCPHSAAMGRRLHAVCTAMLLAVSSGLAACSPADTHEPTKGAGNHGAGRAGSSRVLTSIDQLRPARIPAEGKLRVLATTTLVADVLGAIGGEAIELHGLLPPGIDPHGYEPTPQDLIALSEADVIVVNGLGLEESMVETLASVAGSTAVVSISEGVQARSFGQEATVRGASLQEQRAGGSDPHVWLDPTNVIRWAENAASALGALDPANAPAYRDRREGYIEDLRAFDDWAEGQVSRIPPEDRILVTDHNALGYFAAHYGFRLAGAVIPASSTLAEPSAQELAALLDEIERLQAKAVFVSTTAESGVARRVAEDSGARIVPLYIGSLGPPHGPAATLIDLLKYNVNAIVDALAP